MENYEGFEKYKERIMKRFKNDILIDETVYKFFFETFFETIKIILNNYLFLGDETEEKNV